MTSRTTMAFPPVPHSVSTSIMTCPLPRQARPGMAKKLNGLWRRRFSADCNKATRRFVVGSPPYDPGAYRRIGEWERSKVRFAADSLLERDGFEPSVPRRGQHFFETTP